MRQTKLTFNRKDGKPEKPTTEKRSLEEAKKAPESKRTKPEGSATTGTVKLGAEPMSESSTELIPEKPVIAAGPVSVPPEKSSKEDEKKSPDLPKRPDKVPAHKLIDRLYHPVEDAPFYPGEKVPFSFMVQSLAEIEKCKGENSKDAIKEIMANVFRSISLLHPQELSSAFYFYVLKLAPEYMSKETGGLRLDNRG